MTEYQHSHQNDSQRQTLSATHKRKRGAEGQRSRTVVSDAEEQQLCPQQRYTKRPKHPGMATFDGALRKLPVQGSKVNNDASRSNHHERNHSQSAGEAHAETTPSQTMSSPDVHTHSDVEEPFEPAESHPSRALSNHEIEHEIGISDPSNTLPVLESATLLAQTQPSTHHSISNRTDNLAALESLLPYPRTLHLRVDTKIIYVRLTQTNASHGSTMTASPGSWLSRKLNVWRGLQGLRQALAQENHDFFHISQDAHAPDELRRLAARYSTYTSVMKVNIHDFMRHLHSLAPDTHEQMLTFIDRSRTFLETFEQTLPSRLGWATISDDLHLYLHALLHAGFPGHCVYECDAYTDSSRWQQWMAFQQSSAHTLDDALREWYCQKFLFPASTAVDEVEGLYRSTELMLSEPVLCLLSGWLCFGPRIARTFQHFIKAFAFLAWFGATT